MVVVGVVQRLGLEPGYYGRGEPAAAAAQWSRAQQATLGGAAAAAAMGLASIAIMPVSSLGLVGWAAVTAWQWWKVKPLARMCGLEPDNALGWAGAPSLPPPDSILITSWSLNGDFRGCDDPVFHGLLRSNRELHALFSANGGMVDMWIVPQAGARRPFGRVGGGALERGIFVPHPKEPTLLIPVGEYATRVQSEILQEWVGAFEALGAKSIKISDVTTTRLGTKAKVPIHEVPVGMGGSAETQRSVLFSAEYDKGVFDPERAEAQKVWLRDSPEIMRIIEGRREGRQLRYAQAVSVKLTAGLDASVLDVFKVGLEGGYERTWSLEVEFHPRQL